VPALAGHRDIEDASALGDGTREAQPHPAQLGQLEPVAIEGKLLGVWESQRVPALGLEARVLRAALKEAGEGRVLVAQRLLQGMDRCIGQPANIAAQQREAGGERHVPQGPGSGLPACGSRRKVRLLAPRERLVPHPATGPCVPPHAPLLVGRGLQPVSVAGMHLHGCRTVLVCSCGKQYPQR